jgi:TonB family protein
MGKIGKGFWVAWSIEVVLLALLVWFGLRFYSVYSGCSTADGCASRALKTAFFVKSGDSPLEPPKRIPKFLIEPPEEDGGIPGPLKAERSPGNEGGDRDKPTGQLDSGPPPAKRLAEEAAINAAVHGLQRAAEEMMKEQAEINVGALEVRGSLDHDVVSRIIQRHANEVKHCLRPPKLDGQVVVQFTVAGSGQVKSCRIQESSLADREVERCMERSVRRWRFPRSAGGSVIASCRFIFRGGK